MAYDAGGNWAGNRPGTRRVTSEWDDPTAVEITEGGDVPGVDVRNYRHVVSKSKSNDHKESKTMKTQRTSPDISADPMALADLMGEMTTVEDQDLGQLLAYAPNVGNTHNVTTEGGDTLRLVQMPDEVVDPDAAALACGRVWIADEKQARSIISQSLYQRSKGKGDTVYYASGGVRCAVQASRAEIEGTQVDVVVLFDTESHDEWLPTAFALAARTGSGKRAMLADVRNAERSGKAEALGLLGEKVLTSSYERQTDRGTQPVVESYRVMGYTDDAVGTFHKIARLVDSDKAQKAGVSLAALRGE